MIHSLRRFKWEGDFVFLCLRLLSVTKPLTQLGNMFSTNGVFVRNLMPCDIGGFFVRF